MGRERGPSENLGKLSEAVGEWRAKGGGRGKRIPVELWDEAVRVARVEGVWRTAKATRFEYEGLKRRLAGAEGGEATTAADEIDSTEPARAGKRRRRATAREQSSEFVELSTAQIVGAPPTAMVVEVEDKAGVRMTVRLEPAVDVAQLVAAFRRRGA